MSERDEMRSALEEIIEKDRCWTHAADVREGSYQPRTCIGAKAREAYCPVCIAVTTLADSGAPVAVPQVVPEIVQAEECLCRTLVECEDPADNYTLVRCRGAEYQAEIDVLNCLVVDAIDLLSATREVAGPALAEAGLIGQVNEYISDACIILHPELAEEILAEGPVAVTRHLLSAKATSR